MRALLTALVLLIGVHAPVLAQQFDKTTYYQVLKKGTLQEINKQLELIDAASFNSKDAFKGALLMKKAGVVDVPKQKLDFFKSGRIKLETEIKNDSTNTEFRFLRLIIQEHAPKIVKYSSNIYNDVAWIKSTYGNMADEVQKIMLNYSQSSKYLKPADFK